MTEQFVLSNGLRVVMERMPQLRSISIGVWIKAGSMLEAPQENGLAHFVEHMAFKGTPTRSAKQLAEEIDAIGGQVNAATSKLFTTYYAKVCESDFPTAVALLADLVLHPLLDAAEIDKERNVILEEIAMGEDSPEDQAWEMMQQALYPGQQLAMPITGVKEGILAYGREHLAAFRRRYYQPANAVVSVAGRIRKEELAEILEHSFGAWAGSAQAAYPAHVTSAAGKRLTRTKKTEQLHLCIGYTGLGIDSRDYYAMHVLNTILGGGVSSRLFQRIREEMGLVYSIYSAPTFYPGCGDFVISAAATPRSARQVLKQVHQQIELLLQGGVTQKEMAQAKAQLRTGFVLAQESAYTRMTSMGMNLLIRNRTRTPGQVLRSMEAVTQERVMRVARRILRGNPNLVVVGKGLKSCFRSGCLAIQAFVAVI